MSNSTARQRVPPRPVTALARLLTLLIAAPTFVPACGTPDATVTGTVRATDIRPSPVFSADDIETEGTTRILTEQARHFRSDPLLQQVLADPEIRNHDHLAAAPLSRLRRAIHARPAKGRVIDVRVTLPDRDLALRVCTALIEAAIRESFGILPSEPELEPEPASPDAYEAALRQMRARDAMRESPQVRLQFWRACH